MARKRKGHEISNISEYPRIKIDRNEMMKLTKVAKSWEFTCSFCFKRFPSAQAMGGHQNAHRRERLEEKRLFVRDPIAYRKRAYLQAMKSSPSTSEADAGDLKLHASPKMVKNAAANFNVVKRPPKILRKKPAAMIVCFGEFNVVSANGKNNYFPHTSTEKVSQAALHVNGANLKTVVLNFFPPKELSLAERVGFNAGGAKGKACIEFNVCGYGVNSDLDLTLKL